ncbi:hypothetical protein MNBD_PLANCTO03-53, partial [hydrothermal vent metagenome]
PHRGTLILVLGILSIVISCLPFGIFAWIMGKGDLNKIETGQMDPEGKGLTKAGMICGIIGTIFFAISLLYWVFIIVVAAGAVAAGAAGAAASQTGGLLF